MVRKTTLLMAMNSDVPGSKWTQEQSHHPGIERGNTKWVLLVDDHSLFRQALATVLESQTNLKNRQAGSLAEARQVLAECSDSGLALAVIDLDLPSEGSSELIDDLHQTGTPVLAIVARGRSGWLDRHYEADEIVAKNMSREDILDAVRRLVDD